MTEPEFAQRIRKEFDLPPEQEAILQEAVRAYERLEQIREALTDADLLVQGRGGALKVNPLIQAERAARDALLRTLRALNLQEG